jgi:hypothetical protein
MHQQADVDGFYTIQINRFDGGQPINSLQTFTVAYGRYSLNPRNQDNCSSLVFPAMTASLKEK